MTIPDSETDSLCINTIRTLSIDAVQAAKSGHPGAPLGAATMAYVLWDRHLKHNPRNPSWPDRDRFVLSAGHASALLYSLLYLTGYDLDIGDLRRFRQWGSKAAGHPEHGLTPGVETSTGPLGQGFANAVGMAMAERQLAARFNRPGHDIISHYTYCMVSDGDLEEGISAEAASLAGTLQLGRLIVLYDSNGISIEGPTGVTFTEDVASRFRAYGWHVEGPIDGLSMDAVDAALRASRGESSRPSLIVCRTVIGYGSPNKAGSAAAHGEALGEEETRLTKKQLGWQYEEAFTVPSCARDSLQRAVKQGQEQESAWRAAVAAYATAYPAEAAQLEQDLAGQLPRGWEQLLENVKLDGEPVATRVTGGKALNALAAGIPSFTGGSADLSPSTRTTIAGGGDFGPGNYAGRNLRFGVREHAMAAVCNGMALHGGTIPYASTFLVFYDYMRPAVRLAALMRLRVIFVFTHDSIGVGEDGPTHQPVEHVFGLRSVPGLTVIRPADAAETVEAWRTAMANKEGPTVLVLTRQNVPAIDRSHGSPAAELARGAYVVRDADRTPDAILLATGSEVSIAMESADQLASRGIAVRVVSMPSWRLFETQTRQYRESVLPPKVRRRVSIEAGITLGWERYVGIDGRAIGIDTFGHSAPGPELYRRFDLTADRVTREVVDLMKGEGR